MRRRLGRLAVVVAAVLSMLVATGASSQAITPPVGPPVPPNNRVQVEQLLIDQGVPAAEAHTVATDPTLVFEIEVTPDGPMVVQGTYEDWLAAQVAPAPLSSLSAITVPGGTQVWLSCVWYWLPGVGVRCVNLFYIQYSWSAMWNARVHLDVYKDLQYILCGAFARFGVAVVTTCGLLVLRDATIMRNLVNAGIAQKKCIRMRTPGFGIPGNPLSQHFLVPCRV